MTLAKPLHIHCSGLGETEHGAILLGDRALSQYGSFSFKMVLKKLYLPLSALHICCSGFWVDRALCQCSRVRGNMFLERLYIGDTRESLHIHGSGLLGDKSSSR